MFFTLLLLSLNLFKVHFEYRAPLANSVFLAGSFNDWNFRKSPMINEGNGLFVLDLYLKEGVYQYKFVVNGTQWREDPKGKEFVQDGFCGRNTVLKVNGRAFERIRLRKGDGIINLRLYPVFKPDDVNFANIKDDTLLLIFPLYYSDIDSATVSLNGKIYTLCAGRNILKSVSPGKELSLKVVLYDGKSEAVYFDSVFTVTSVAHFSTPSFLDTTVFYQIFPERFYNGNTLNDPLNTRDWMYEPVLAPSGWSVFYGGDLNGVLKKMGYLKELGVNAVYFNPIFTSYSNHKYDIVDYFHIDPHFGGDSVFFKLLDRFHKNGIKIVLDGVFNHTSDKHPFFKNVREEGPVSPYYDYYIVKKWPFPVHFDRNTRPIDYYACWWGFGSLPKLNYQNPKVVNYILNVAKYWEQKGIDGFRLDVSNEVPHFFWRMFRDTMKKYNGDFYIVGEIWGVPRDWLNGREFDGTMNYPLRDLVIKVINGSIVPSSFVRSVSSYYKNIPEEGKRAMLNIISTHDTRRIKTVFHGSEEKVKSAYLLAFTMPGVPCIYYGDEIGMSGEKDPDSRRPFSWDLIRENKGLRTYFKRLIRFRKRHPEFANGDINLCGIAPVCIERSGYGHVFKLYVNISDSSVKLPENTGILFDTGKKDMYLKPYEGVVVEE